MQAYFHLRRFIIDPISRDGWARFRAIHFHVFCELADFDGLTVPRHLRRMMLRCYSKFGLHGWGKEVINNKMNPGLLMGHIAGAILFVTQPALAALIDADWQTPGDAKLLLDTSTGMQWLDRSVTVNRS